MNARDMFKGYSPNICIIDRYVFEDEKRFQDVAARRTDRRSGLDGLKVVIAPEVQSPRSAKSVGIDEEPGSG